MTTDRRKASLRLPDGEVTMTVDFESGTSTVAGRIRCVSVGPISTEAHATAYSQLQAFITGERLTELAEAKKRRKSTTAASKLAADARSLDAAKAQVRADRWFDKAFRGQGHVALLAEATAAARAHLTALAKDEANYRASGNIGALRACQAATSTIEKHDLPALTTARAKAFLAGKN